jgi:hypothetical protein
MFLTTFDKKLYEEAIRLDAIEDGREQGRAEERQNTEKERQRAEQERQRAENAEAELEHARLLIKELEKLQNK